MNAQLAERPANLDRANEDDTEVIPKLGLDGILAGELARLEVVVRNTKSEVIAHIEAQLTALIVSPLNHILYLEAACTSDSGAHALMGAVSDSRGSPEFRFFKPGEKENHQEIFPPTSPSISNIRLQVSNFHKTLNHVAMLDRSGELLLSQDDEMLWRKLREKMTCPTLEHWGQAVMAEVYESGMLLECEAFGVPAGFTPYVLAPDAQEIFDSIICKYVEVAGIKQLETKAIIKLPARTSYSLFDIEDTCIAAGS